MVPRVQSLAPHSHVTDIAKYVPHHFLVADAPDDGTPPSPLTPPPTAEVVARLRSRYGDVVSLKYSRTIWSAASDSAAAGVTSPTRKSQQWNEPDGEPLLLRLISATNLPKHDVFSHSDPFVTVDVLQPGRRTPLISANWPIKWDSANPVWDSCRLLGEAAADSSALSLRLTFYDYDANVGVQTKELMGTAETAIEALKTGAPPTVLPLVTVKEPKGGLPATVRVQRLPFAGLPRRKTVYLVRHGESVWNQAQASKDVGAMLGDTDHPLNHVGRVQAEALQASLLAGGADAEALLASELLLCSPLTRAVQTCLIGLAPMLEGRAAGTLRLNPNLREKRNFGGKDSSGKWHGPALEEGVRQAMLTLYGDELARGATLSAPTLDLSQVMEQWWADAKESHEMVAERVTELLAQVRFCEARSIVLVGHSHYFRELLRNSCAADCTIGGSAEPPAALLKKKLSNGGVARLEMDFERDRPVTGVELLFGTRLVS